MEETRTMFRWAIPAFRSAISKLFSFSLLIPTPRVRKSLRGTNLTSFLSFPICATAAAMP